MATAPEPAPEVPLPSAQHKQRQGMGSITEGSGVSASAYAQECGECHQRFTRTATSLVPATASLAGAWRWVPSPTAFCMRVIAHAFRLEHGAVARSLADVALCGMLQLPPLTHVASHHDRSALGFRRAGGLLSSPLGFAASIFSSR